MPCFSKGNVVARIFELKDEDWSYSSRRVRILKTNSIITLLFAATGISGWHVWLSKHLEFKTSRLRNDCNPADRCNQRIYPETKELEAQDRKSSLESLSEAELFCAQQINSKLMLNINAHLTALKMILSDISLTWSFHLWTTEKFVSSTSRGH